MTKLDPHPQVGSIVSTRDGYRTVVLAIVDGFPAQIRIEIDTRDPRMTRAAISVWTGTAWTDDVWQLDADDIGRMPLLHTNDGQDALDALQRVADRLWSFATVMVPMARQRNEQLALEAKLAETRATSAMYASDLILGEQVPVGTFAVPVDGFGKLPADNAGDVEGDA